VAGELVPEVSGVIAALLAGATVATLALAAMARLAAFQRKYRARIGPAAARRALPGAPAPLQLFRRTVVALLAVASRRVVAQKMLDKLAAALRRAGHPAELSPEETIALMELSGGLFLVLGVCLSVWLDLTLLAVPAATLLGAAYPLIWLRDRIRWRHQAMVRALPYNLDLLTLSVEAGLDFAAALGKVVDKGRKGPLCDELSITLKELKLGKTRDEALRNLSARVELQSLTGFVQALVHADRMGTPLGKILRILSTQMRVERTQRAEKLANEAPVKLLLPLIGCIFPTIFLMLFGPIAYQVFFGGNF